MKEDKVNQFKLVSNRICDLLDVRSQFTEALEKISDKKRTGYSLQGYHNLIRPDVNNKYNSELNKLMDVEADNYRLEDKILAKINPIIQEEFEKYVENLNKRITSEENKIKKIIK